MLVFLKGFLEENHTIRSHDKWVGVYWIRSLVVVNIMIVALDLLSITIQKLYRGKTPFPFNIHHKCPINHYNS